MAEVAVPSPGRRIAAIDVARGVAIVAMIVYHFAWDLWAFGLVATDVGDGPWWRLFAHAIATTFLTLVGIGLVLATRNGFNAGAFWRRTGLIAGGAVLVTVATYVIEPREFVFFGILHLIAVASVLAFPFLPAPVWVTAVAAVAAIAIGNYVVTPVFDAPWLVWIGLADKVEATVDYYPLLPWFGVVLAGIVVGKLALATGADAALARWPGDDPLSRFLAVAGRWSLLIYLLHQVVLYGAVSLAAGILSPPSPAAPARVDPTVTFMDECLPVCGGQGKDAATCTAYCACMYAGLSTDGLLSIDATALTDPQKAQLNARSRQCLAPAPAPGR